MRSLDWLKQAQKAAKLNRQTWAPGQRTTRTWPICMTCNKEVDAVDLKNVNATSCEIWAKHHGKEDYYKVTFPYRCNGDPLEDENVNFLIKRAMHDFCPFDPTQVPK